VHVPDETDEALRDLVRAWNGARQDLRQAKQRLKSFLLVHGVRYEGNANWKEPHRRWLARFTFPQAWSQMALEEHRRAVEDRLAQSQRLEQLLRQEVVHWRLYPVIQALQALRGVQFTVAVGVIAETGDLSRFHNPRQLMDWLGLGAQRRQHRHTHPQRTHHQGRQCAGPAPADRSGLELSLQRQGQSHHPAPA
jgi:transposase